MVVVKRRGACGLDVHSEGVSMGPTCVCTAVLPSSSRRTRDIRGASRGGLGTAFKICSGPYYGCIEFWQQLAAHILYI